MTSSTSVECERVFEAKARLPLCWVTPSCSEVHESTASSGHGTAGSLYR